MRYPAVVQVAWDVVEKFLREWQYAPYKWDKEIDVQAELYSRLASVYRAIGKDEIRGNYKDVVVGFEGKQIWSRVCCEPRIPYVYRDGKKYHCFPDLVVWDDAENPDNPPDTGGDTSWPILWVCEIKFYGESSQGKWDIEKMSYLLTQGRAKYGCWLNMHLARAKRGSGMYCKKSVDDERLWVWTAELPAKKSH